MKSRFERDRSLHVVFPQVAIVSASGGAELGHTQRTVVTVVGDDGESVGVAARAPMHEV